MMSKENVREKKINHVNKKEEKRMNENESGTKMINKRRKENERR